MSNTRILYLFTRTPLHVGAGASVGAIDQPIIRERHTGFPIIPASSLKGTFADVWNDSLLDERNAKGEAKKVRVKADGTASDAAWLFGSDSDMHAAAGSLLFSEARLIAFPIRSAKGGFAWVTCPLMLQRAVRDGALTKTSIDGLREPGDEEAIFNVSGTSKLNLEGQLVLEEYTFKCAHWDGLEKLGNSLAELLAADPVWGEVSDRLVILSNGMMSYFAVNACDVAQHVRISDETGTAEGGALFNQENVPGEAFFYSVLHALHERTAGKSKEARRDAGKALDIFANATDGKTFQFGGDASTGLGFCTLKVADQKGA